MATVIPISELRKPLVKPEAMAEYLSCTVDYLLRLARKGEIPALKMGNGARSLWRFNLDDVVRALEVKQKAASPKV